MDCGPLLVLDVWKGGVSLAVAWQASCECLKSVCRDGVCVQSTRPSRVVNPSVNAPPSRSKCGQDPDPAEK